MRWSDIKWNYVYIYNYNNKKNLKRRRKQAEPKCNCKNSRDIIVNVEEIDYETLEEEEQEVPELESAVNVCF